MTLSIIIGNRFERILTFSNTQTQTQCEKESPEFYFFSSGVHQPLSPLYLGRAKKEDEFIIDNESFTCVEQYFQASKAKYFEDQNARETIMKSKNPYEMRAVRVKNFDMETWHKHCEEIMTQGIQAKVSQDDYFRRLKPPPKKLAYASADPFWGTGIALHLLIPENMETWQGQNKLGKIWMRVLCQTPKDEGDILPETLHHEEKTKAQ